MFGIFLDSETNGLDPYKHVILELALKACDLSTGETLGTYEALICPTQNEWEKSDSFSLSVNGLKWQDVERGKSRNQVSKEVIHLFETLGVSRKKAVFICHNPSFDRVFFSQVVNAYEQEKRHWPYHWLDLASLFWSDVVSKVKKGEGVPSEINFSKDTIARLYGLPAEETPHKAMNGVDHLIACYQKIVGFPKRQ